MSNKTEYEELRKVYRDNAVVKGRLLLDYISTVGNDVAKYSKELLDEAMEEGHWQEHDKIGDQYAESVADLRKAQESIETAVFFIVKALHHGNAMDLLNLEAE